MTIEELRVIIADIQSKSVTLVNASQGIQQLADDLLKIISADNPFSSTINIEQLVSMYAPIYIEKLTAVEIAADDLGTDILH